MSKERKGLIRNKLEEKNEYTAEKHKEQVRRQLEELGIKQEVIEK